MSRLGCTIVLAFAVVSLFPPSARAQAAAPRVVIAAGIDWSSFTGAAPIEEEGQETVGFALQSSGIGASFAAEVALLDWIAAGVAHERLSRVALEQTFEVVGFRDFSSALTSVFDPDATEVYAAPSWPLDGPVRVSGMVGVAFWRAAQDSTVTLLFQQQELSSETLREEHSGTGLLLGIGLDVWLHRRLGVRAGYKYLSLSSDAIDEPVHNLRVLALFGF